MKINQVQQLIQTSVLLTPLIPWITKIMNPLDANLPDKLDEAGGASKMPLADLRTAWWTTCKNQEVKGRVSGCLIQGVQKMHSLF